MGTARVPEAADIEKGNAALKEKLTAAAETAIHASLPKEFRIIEGASMTTPGKRVVADIADMQGNFSIFQELTVKAIAFREADPRERELSLMRREKGADMTFATSTVTYGAPTADFTKGILRVPVAFRGSVIRPVDTAALAREIAGKSSDNARLLLLKIPGLEQAEMAISPPWARFRMPPRVERIHIDAE